MRNGPISFAEILLVESNPGDVSLIQNTLQENKFYNKVSIIENINEAVMLGNHTGSSDNFTYPDIILISLSSILAEKNIAAVEELKNISFYNSEIFILTNDEVEEDFLKEHSIKYPTIRRPIDFYSFIDEIVSRDHFKSAVVKDKNRAS